MKTTKRFPLFPVHFAPIAAGVVMLLLPESSRAQSSYTWTGGSGSGGNWSDANNWGGAAPASLQSFLNFTNSTRLNNTNDFAAGSAGWQIYFKGGAGTGAFNLYGNGINFFDLSGTDPNIQNEGTVSQTISFPITNANTHVSGSVRILNINANASPAQGPMVFTGPISTPNDSLARMINISGGGAITFNGVISDGGAASAQGITQAGAGTITLAGANAYHGQTTINAGTVSIGNNGNLGANTAPVSINGGTLKITAAITGAAYAHTNTIGAGGGTHSVQAGLGGQFAFGNAGTLAGSGALSITGDGTLQDYAVTGANFKGNTSINAAQSGYTGVITLQNGGSLEFNGGSTAAPWYAIGSGGELIVDASPTISTPITASGGGYISFNGNGIVSGSITNSGGLTVVLRQFWNSTPTYNNGEISGLISGAGALTVGTTVSPLGWLGLAGGGSSYTGGTIVNGQLLVGAAAPLSGTAANAANTPAATQSALGTGTVTINTGGIVQVGYHSPSTGSAYYVTNAVTLNGGAIWANDAYQHFSGPINVTGNSFLGSTYSGSSGTYGPASGYNKGLFIDGLVSGSGNLTIEQAGAGGNGANGENNGWGNGAGNPYNVGIVIFTNNANTYSGTITVYPYNSGGGSYLCVNGATTLQNATINLTGNNTGGTQLYGASPLTFRTGLGSVTLGALQGGANVVLTGENEGNATFGGDAIALTVGGNNANTIYSGVLSGNGSLTKTGAGTMTNSGVNTYTGTTTINNGALQLGHTNAAMNSTVSIGVANGLKFSSGIGGFNLGGLGGAGSESLLDVAGAAVALTVGSNNASTTYSGVLSGAGSLTKAGTGSLTLSTGNTYSGGTTNLNGTLIHDAGGNSGAVGIIGPFGTGNVILNGGTLQLGHNVGTHNNTVFTITNAVTVNGATIYEEDGIQHLTGALTIGSSATLGSTYNAGSGDGNKGLYLDGVVGGSGPLTLKQTGINTGNAYDTSFVCFSNNANSYSGTISLIPMSGAAGGSYVGINAGSSLANATLNITNNTSSAQVYGASPIVFLTNIVAASIGALGGSG
ncbi:MAG TPA: autotransporter-associated beta strand repeat-containing protein, partial [Verrucomicrobiae bacterium]